MLNKNNLIIRIGYALLPSLLLAQVFYLIYLGGVSEKITLHIQLTAENSDVLALYWPDNSGKYLESQTTKVKYPSGTSEHELSLSVSNRKDALRLDPGTMKNTVTINAISFSRFDALSNLHIDRLKELIIKSNDTSFSKTAEGLELSFTSIDPQIYIQGYPTPVPEWPRAVAYITSFLLACLVLTYAAYRLLQRQTVVFRWNILFMSGTGLVLDWVFLLPFYLLLAISFLITYATIQTMYAVKSCERKSVFVVPLQALLVIGCFLILILLPLLGTISPQSKFINVVGSSVHDTFANSETDSYHTRIKALIKTIEDSFTHRFVFKKDLVNLNATTKIFGFGFSPTSKAIVGQDGMFFEGYGQRRVEGDITGTFDNITDYMGLIPFSEDELEAWLVCLEERYYWLKEQGTDYIFVLAPTKALIYPEKLPPRILRMKTAINKPTRYEQLVSYLKKNSVVPMVDLRKSLIAAKQNILEGNGLNDLLLYYRTDFHWNYYGAFLAYQAIIDEINQSYPHYQFKAARLDEFTVHKKTNWVDYAFIYSLGLDPHSHKNETYVTFFPKPESVYTTIAAFHEKGISDYSLPEPVTKVYNRQKMKTRQLENTNGETPLIFVIGDSFSEKYFGFFSGHAEKTINFRTVYKFFPDAYREHSPNLVIQEVLNMYLLQKPPVNPHDIKGARAKIIKRKNHPQSNPSAVVHN